MELYRHMKADEPLVLRGLSVDQTENGRTVGKLKFGILVLHPEDTLEDVRACIQTAQKAMCDPMMKETAVDFEDGELVARFYPAPDVDKASFAMPNVKLSDIKFVRKKDGVYLLFIVNCDFTDDGGALAWLVQNHLKRQIFLEMEAMQPELIAEGAKQ